MFLYVQCIYVDNIILLKKDNVFLLSLTNRL